MAKRLLPNSPCPTKDRYDIFTNSTSFIPSGGAAENQYTEEMDQWGRVIARKGYPDGSENPAIQESYQYDLVGNLLVVTDANGNDTRFQYDRLNRIRKVINALGESVDCDYDRLGNVVNIQQYEGDRTFTTTKIYDERGSLLTQELPEGNPTTYQYNALGLPVEVTDAGGKVTTLLYDDSNHVIEKSVNQQQLKYYYNPLGGVDKCEVWANGTPGEHLDYDYYSTGLTKERTVGNYTVGFEYNLVGSRTKVTDPFDYAVNYSYTNLHRLDTITAGGKVFDYEYYADGMIAAVDYPALTGGGTLRY